MASAVRCPICTRTGTKPDPGGGGGGQHDHHRGRGAGHARVEVVLGQPVLQVADLLGLLREIDAVAERLPGGGAGWPLPGILPVAGHPVSAPVAAGAAVSASTRTGLSRRRGRRVRSGAIFVAPVGALKGVAQRPRMSGGAGTVAITMTACARWSPSGYASRPGGSRRSGCCRPRTAGYAGSARNFRRLVAEVKAGWRSGHHRGRRAAVLAIVPGPPRLPAHSGTQPRAEPHPGPGSAGIRVIFSRPRPPHQDEHRHDGRNEEDGEADSYIAAPVTQDITQAILDALDDVQRNGLRAGLEADRKSHRG